MRAIRRVLFMDAMSAQSAALFLTGASLLMLVGMFVALAVASITHVWVGCFLFSLLFQRDASEQWGRIEKDDLRREISRLRAGQS